MKYCNYFLVRTLILPILFSSISFTSNLPGEVDNNSNNGYNLFSLNFLQNSYAIETTDEKDEEDAIKQDKNNNKDSKET
ncbi:MAG: hypothetical protein ACXWFB_06070, partial [Nitrososphaeraceae archaeon]